MPEEIMSFQPAVIRNIQYNYLRSEVMALPEGSPFSVLELAQARPVRYYDPFCYPMLISEALINV